MDLRETEGQDVDFLELVPYRIQRSAFMITLMDRLVT
jgi:hypothetical protein